MNVFQVDDGYLDTNRAILCVQTILDTLNNKKLMVSEHHTHYKQKIVLTQEMINIWNTYSQNIDKVRNWILILNFESAALITKMFVCYLLGARR